MNSKNRTISIPLFWKFAIISTVVVLIFGFVNMYLLWTSVYETFDKEIDQRVKVLAKIVSDKALTPMVYDDNLSLYSVLDDIQQSDSSISYIFLLNNSGELVAQTYDVHVPQSLIEANSLISGQYSIKVINASHFAYPVIRDIAYPVLNGEVGTVRLGIAENHVQEQMQSATADLLTMLVAFFVFGLTGAFFFSYIITTPIKKISKKAQIIDFDYIETADYNIVRRKRISLLNIRVNDEMDVLVTKFTEMLDRLRDSYTKLKEKEQALIQAEKLASLGTLSAGVAHEINNPISGIKNCVNRIMKYPDNKEQNAEYILLIKEAADRMENVVKHLLKFSRKQEFTFEKVHLNEVINNAIELTDHKLRSNNVLVKVDMEDDFYIGGSANHLEQVFVNLILNGLDAILERREKEPSHKGLIEISAIRRNHKAYIHIKDNGMGIPDEIKNQVFDPFFTSKEIDKGTGLGLSVSFNLIKEHKGKIIFYSTKGVGTEFIIELPCHSK